MNVFIQQRRVNLIKSDSKDVKNVTNSAVKWLIQKSFCLHNMCVYCVYL